MTIEELIAEFIRWRAAERLIAMAIGALSIALGYHLFRIGVVGGQEGVLEKGGFKLHLVKVGPGVFFSLFGAVLVGYVAYAQFELREVVEFVDRSQEPVDGANEQSRKIEVVGFSSGKIDKLKQLVPATNSLRDIVAELNASLRSSVSSDVRDLLNRLSVVSFHLQGVSTTALLDLAPPEVHSACLSGESLPTGFEKDICETISELEDSRL